jgi:hypothetical protein
VKFLGFACGTHHDIPGVVFSPEHIRGCEVLLPGGKQLGYGSNVLISAIELETDMIIIIRIISIKL